MNALPCVACVRCLTWLSGGRKKKKEGEKGTREKAGGGLIVDLPQGIGHIVNLNLKLRQLRYMYIPM